MHAEKSNHTLSRMARLLGVSRSGYYAWLKREPSKRAVRRERIEAKIAWFHGDSDEVSGSPRILADLREDGEVISRKTVAKAMRKLGLRGICPKKWRTTTILDHADAYPPDATKRRWDSGALNAVWVGDISYLRTWQGWLYLATVIDAHSRRVIGWAIDEHMRTDLVEDALQMAITLRGELPANVVFHTDRGTQGEINRWSQHLVTMEVFDGSSTTGFRSCRAAGDEVAWASASAQACGAGVLATYRRGDGERGRSGCCRRVRARRVAMVPPRWRNATDHSGRAVWPVPVVC